MRVYVCACARARVCVCARARTCVCMYMCVSAWKDGVKDEERMLGERKGGWGRGVIETAFADNDNFQVIFYCARHL